jgi:hypothetical protein
MPQWITTQPPAATFLLNAKSTFALLRYEPGIGRRTPFRASSRPFAKAVSVSLFRFSESALRGGCETAIMAGHYPGTHIFVTHIFGTHFFHFRFHRIPAPETFALAPFIEYI